MKSLWSDEDAQAAVKTWGRQLGERIYTARLIGADSSLVLHGGGNVSLKATHTGLTGESVDAIYVKGTGHDLGRLTSVGLPGINLAYLRSLRSLDTLTDDSMLNEIRTHLFDASAVTPSMETLLHAFLPHRFIDHSHADAVLALTNQPDGEKLIRQAVREKIAVLPYIAPGFELAKAVADAYDADPDIEGIVLLFHGLITFGDDARSSYEKHIAIVDSCERFVAHRITTSQAKSSTSPARSSGDTVDSERWVARAAPMLRGFLSEPSGNEDQPHRRLFLEWRKETALLAALDRIEPSVFANTGPLTGDHLIHTKPWPTLLEAINDEPDEPLRNRLTECVTTYRDRYESYVREYGGTDMRCQSGPRVILVPGVGLLCWGTSKRHAGIVADIAEHTVLTKADAQILGRYTSLPEKHLFDMEFRRWQRAKLADDSPHPLCDHVIVISGGAGAIGAAIAEVCANAGAHVVVTDLDGDRVARVVEGIKSAHEPGRALGLVMDVTDETSVRNGFEQIVRYYGGVDVVVPNAGIAHVASIDELSVGDFRRVMEVNAVGYFIFMREGIRVMKRQGLGGHVIINASKNVFGPGKDFGAYSASKAAGHQLGKVAAIEGAPFQIRVNMINADAVFGDAENPSGLWATVGPERARSRNLSQDELAQYYRQRNLLKATVHGRHVGNAVVFFASNLTPTTGATLPVDGGVIEAFPR